MTTDRAEQAALVGIPQIAEIAGVGRSAVGNWRKRHSDFPAPKVQTPSGALFDLTEVEDWLIEQGKIERRASASARLWSVANAARGDWASDEFMRFSVSFLVYLETCARARAQREGASSALPVPRVPQRSEWAELRNRMPEQFLRDFTEAAKDIETANPDLVGLLDPQLRDQDAPGVSALAHRIAVAFDEATDQDTTRYALLEGLDDLEAGGRFSGEFATPRDVAGLVAGLVHARGGTILDPAVGEGRLLITTAESVEGQANTQLAGVDKNAEACRRARSRFYLAGREAEIRLDDALRAAPSALPFADTIVLDPPYGLADWGTADLYVDPSWRFGPAPPSSADFAWLQLASMHLKPDGCAAVLMGTGSLTRSGREGAIRTKMVEAGVIEAVVVLPPRLRTNTSIPLAVWLLRSDNSPQRDVDVLLVDASSFGEPGRSRYSLGSESVQRLVALMHRWRMQRTISQANAAFAVAVPTSAILAAEASLLPARYQSAPEVDLDEIRREATSLRDAFAQRSAAASRANAELVAYLERRR